MKDLINPNVICLMPYIAGKPIEEIQAKYNLKKVVKLASNENPFPIPKNVSDAIKSEISSIRLYPDSDCYLLKKRIAEYNKVGFENVVAGAGLVEIIKMIIRTFLKPGEKVLSSEKTFLLYRIATIEYQGKGAYIEIKMDEDYKFDLHRMFQMIDDKTRIIFITNPNNPTGTVLPKKKILDFINRVPEDKIIVLDNAYHEYVSDSENYLDGIDLALKRKNVIVLRTFSKIYALAGLRVGYGISNEEIVSYLNIIKAPFSITRIAQKAAVASLENDDFKNKSAKLNFKNKKKLFNQLKGMGLRVIPSETNFLFFIPGTDIHKLNVKLLREGVIIRPLQAFGAPEGMRVTVGCEEDNNFFVDKLKKVLIELK